MYGIAKLSSSAVKEAILSAIREKLDHCDNFANDSLGFYGVEYHFKIDFTFHARQEEQLMVEGRKFEGDLVPGAVITKDVVEGTHAAGKTKKKATA